MIIAANDLDEEMVAQAAALMTSERLARYHALTGSNRGALELHAHAMRVAGSMLAAIGVVEIALRNAVGEKLAVLLGRADWLQNPPSGVGWRRAEKCAISQAIKHARRSAYASLPHQEKMALDDLAFPSGVPAGTRHADRVKARQRQIVVAEGQVVAQLTFGFWKGLFSEDYEASLWRRSLRAVFPRKTLDRAVVATHLEVIYQTRNRIAHHEALDQRRIAAVRASIDFVAGNLQWRDDTAASPLARLLASHLALVDEHAAAFAACRAGFDIETSPPP